MTDDFTQCLVGNSRMAARAITRRYDAFARPHGLTSTQLSLLAVIQESGGQSVSELAEQRGFDRTTLTRNLDRLQTMGLIASGQAEKGNGRICVLSEKGKALIHDLLPAWRKAQAAMRAELGSKGFDHTLRVLKRLAKV